MHEQHLFSDSSVQSSVLQLCEVKIIYSQKLIKMSVKEPDVNETWLKERLLYHIPELEKEEKLYWYLKHILGLQKRCSTFQGNFNEDNIQNCVLINK